MRGRHMAHEPGLPAGALRGLGTTGTRGREWLCESSHVEKALNASQN